MPDFEWTPQQELAINSKGSNILVSAAAGSGKTAVLVERVIRKITDKNNPVDLDSLVIMTFTKAAAAQMRQKIFKAIRKALLDDPDNEHLKKQIIKVHTARICTIDSLCLDIVKENFQMVDVDPAFTVADEAEEKMLEEDILKNLLEEKYQAAEPDFMELAGYYTEKSDSKLEDLILQLFRFAQSHPVPYGWLKSSVLPYTGGSEMEWFKDLERTIRDNINEARKMAEAGLRIANLPNGPDKYIEPFEYIIEMCSHMSGLKYEDMGAAIKAEIDVWKRSPSYSKTADVDARLKDLAKDTRADIKDKLIGLRDSFYYASLPDMLKDMEKCAPIAQTIVNLTIEFSERLKEAKKERKIADFSDVAHFALDVLIAHDEDGRIIAEDDKICYTRIADRIASEIDEIIVDEYQDTNMLQEFIIMALSSERFGRPNVFMVGDVKQSIYSFRMACPELFMSKYDSYGKTDPNGQRIILDSNFRSRTGVINLSNYIFRQIMTREATGIDYCDGNELTHASTIPEKDGMTPEIVFIDGTASDGRKAEGYEIARIIEDIIKNGEVYDSENEQYRPARFSDIALITRNTDNPQIEKILNERRIPMQKESGKGFFDSFEIRLCLDLMSIIDNPYQDIPFAAVLYSPVVGASADDLARIRILNREDKLSLYEACRKHGLFKWFIERIEEWQRRSIYMPISDFLTYVLEDSGLMSILLAMPSGQSRKGNIEFLRSRASAFSRSSYSGLFNFIRYIKQLKDSDIDFGNAQSSADRFDAVKVMTIHKSKGLEFPYVIIGGYGKNFNKSDSSNSIILERNYGVGIEFRDQETKEKRNTIFMELLKLRSRGNSAAEEMRVLYVALTRAKEKLYLVGSSNNMFSSADKKWSMSIYETDEQLSMQKILLSNNFMEMTGIALARHSCFSDAFKERGIDTDPSNPLYNGKCAFEITLESFEDVESKRVEEIIDNAVTRKELEEMIAGGEQFAPEEYERLKKDLAYQYPFHDATREPIKKTASQLEKYKAASEEPDKDSDDEELNSFKAKKHGSLTGAERGNAYHRVFELIEYNSSEPAAEQIRKMQASGRISEEYAKAVDAKVVDAFIASQVGRRMAKAAAAGKLFREQPFVRGYTEKIDGEDEMLLIQGIIDAFFEENGELVLIDYKTDRNRTEAELIETYKPQQDAYAAALTDAYQMPVKEMIIYSTSLGKEINL